MIKTFLVRNNPEYYNALSNILDDPLLFFIYILPLILLISIEVSYKTNICLM